MHHRKRRIWVGLAALTAVLAGVTLWNGGHTTAEAQSAGGSPRLTPAEINRIMNQAVERALTVASAPGLRSGPNFRPKRPTKMQVAVVARDGRLLNQRAMQDAWVGSIDIAIAKARTAAFFSSNENALTSRIIGVLSQPHGPNGEGTAGPLWGIWASNQVGITGGPTHRNGIITFPGGVPLYRGNQLVGGVGVSGDAVDQDEAVAFAAARGFEPGTNVIRTGFTLPTVPPFP